MSPEEKIEQLYKNADFDKNGLTENKIYAKINTRKSGARALWLLAGAAAAMAALVFWPHADELQNPQAQNEKQNTPSANAEITQEECIDLSTRYWFEQAAEQGKLIMAKCPKEVLNEYNNNLIYSLNQKLEQSNQKLTLEERKKLDDCGEKFKMNVHPIMSYDVRC